jgi:hypothetical protein
MHWLMWILTALLIAEMIFLVWILTLGLATHYLSWRAKQSPGVKAED